MNIGKIKKTLALALVGCLCQMYNVNAQVATPKPQVVEDIYATVGDTAMRNILEAEQVFCYTVETKKRAYSGYTLDGMALTGFCGVLNKQITASLTEMFFMQKNNVDLENQEDCTIKPNFLLRFVRGVDYADVMVSSPCEAMVVFYGGKKTLFNLKPIKAAITKLADTLEKTKKDFVSPALLKQVMPIGLPQTEEQKNLVNQAAVPIKSWETKQPAQPKNEKQDGWNSLNAN